MSADWIETTIGDISTWTSGGTPKKDVSEYWNGNIPWISANSMHGTRFSDSDLKISEAGLENGSRLAPKDSVLLLVRGGALHNRLPVGMAMRDVAFNQDVKALIADKSLIDPWYLLYWLVGNEKFLLESIVEETGIGAGKLDTKRMQSLKILIPPLSEQEKILLIVKTIDDKIELNRQINQTLEQMAQAIFKSWFVDFDPVRAKMEGRDTGLPKHIADLFPNELVESELGLVPKGWNALPLYETAEYVNGAAFKSEDFSEDAEGIPIIKIAELKQGITAQTKFTTKTYPEKYTVDSGDIFYSWSGSPETSLDIFKWFGGRGWLNQHIFKLNFSSPEQKYFTYYLIKHMRPILVQTALDKQTTGLGHVTVADMKRIKTVYPDGDVLKAFAEIVSSIYDQSSQLEIQATTLAEIRDSLLPKLLSGEIKINSENMELKETI